MLSRARRLSSLSTTNQRRLGDVGVDHHLVLGLRVVLPAVIDCEVHRRQLPLRASDRSRRDWNRASCSASLTENQYLRSMMPSSTSIRSKIGHWWRKRWYSSAVQKPITCSTPARLYQERSNSTISPAAGRCAM